MPRVLLLPSAQGETPEYAVVDGITVDQVNLVELTDEQVTRCKQAGLSVGPEPEPEPEPGSDAEPDNASTDGAASDPEASGESSWHDPADDLTT